MNKPDTKMTLNYRLGITADTPDELVAYGKQLETEFEKAYSIPLSSDGNFDIVSETKQGTIGKIKAELQGNFPESLKRNNTYRLRTGSLSISAKEMYEFLVGVEGYVFLDPYSDPEDFNKPVFGPFPMSENEPGHHCQLEYAEFDLPLCFSRREFSVLNVYQPSTYSFISVSVRNEKIEGASSYESETGAPLKGKHWRATNWSCFRVFNDPEDSTKCIVDVYGYFDMAFAVNAGCLGFLDDFVAKMYMKDLAGRFAKKFAN